MIMLCVVISMKIGWVWEIFLYWMCVHVSDDIMKAEDRSLDLYDS